MGKNFTKSREFKTVFFARQSRPQLPAVRQEVAVDFLIQADVGQRVFGA